MKVFVTGCAGFIGMHVCERLLARGDLVVGIDNLNDYYDVSLKQARLARLTPQPGFSFHKIDIADRAEMATLFGSVRPQRVVHLAAQAGVRYSLKNPHAYVDSNLVGFVNVLEGCRHAKVEHLVYASSSSVYGGNTKLPFSEHDNVDHPVSLYAATKKANELMAHSYSHLYGLPTTGLRFFTVYGPWGRPDMALFLFTRAILDGKPIDVFNNGEMQRDFTYIDDISEGVVRTVDCIPLAASDFDRAHPRPDSSWAPFDILNIGNHQPVGLDILIELLERTWGKRAEQRLLPLQSGDVVSTMASIEKLHAKVGFAPKTPIEEGIRRFVAWYRDYYGVSNAST